jgi:3-isopropylmalate/(R)-2-methylmalate dehydratase small subunit
MQPITRIQSRTVVIPSSNIDTDKIIAAQFLKTVSRSGLGTLLFSALRYDRDGAERPDFVLNRPPWRNAVILVTGKNFGCGSSREHAPWALRDFGVRCLVAESFADIFHANCIKNGILPIPIDVASLATLLTDAADPATATMTIDLARQRITRACGLDIDFTIDPARRRALMEGAEEITETLLLAEAIDAFEAKRSHVPRINLTVMDRGELAAAAGATSGTPTQGLW